MLPRTHCQSGIRVPQINLGDLQIHGRLTIRFVFDREKRFGFGWIASSEAVLFARVRIFAVKNVPAPIKNKP